MKNYYAEEIASKRNFYAEEIGKVEPLSLEALGPIRKALGAPAEVEPSWLEREILAPAKDISLKHVPEHFKLKPTPVEQIPQFTELQPAEAATTAVPMPTPPKDSTIRAPEEGEFEKGPFKPMEIRAGEEQIDVLGRELESLKGFATFPVTASKFVFDFWRNMARSLGDSPEGKRRYKELRQEGALQAEDFARGAGDWLLMAAGDQGAELRIAERIKERGVVAESIYPLIITGVVRGGAKFTGKLSEAIKVGKSVPEFLGEAHIPTAKAKVTEVISEKPAVEQPIIPGRETLDLTKALREKGVTEEPPVGEAHVPTRKGKLPRADTKVRGLSQHIADRAIREKLMEKDVELPEYEIARIKAASERAVKLNETDPAKAKRVATGEEAPPSGERFDAAMAEVVVENAAIKAGDGATIRDLAFSKLAKEATEAGQFIRMFAEREPESPVGAIRSYAKVKEKIAKRRVGDIDAARKTEMESLRSQIKKARPTRQTIEQFIESIRC